MAAFRTDMNNNPTAATTDLAQQAGLRLGIDYVPGTPFPAGSNLVTAKLLGDPVVLSIRLIDAVGYYTKGGTQRWSYIALPHFIWDGLNQAEKVDVIGWMYQREAGVKMRPLFPNYGRS